LAVVTAATVMVAGVGPVWVPVLVRPPLLERQVAVWLVMALPLSAPSAKVTLSESVVVVVDPDTALTAVGAAGTPTTVIVCCTGAAAPVESADTVIPARAVSLVADAAVVASVVKVPTAATAVPMQARRRFLLVMVSVLPDFRPPRCGPSVRNIRRRTQIGFRRLWNFLVFPVEQVARCCMCGAISVTRVRAVDRRTHIARRGINRT
jgi:hypothetical protein